VVPLRRASVSNHLCSYPTEADKQGAREEAVAGQLEVFRQLLPRLLAVMVSVKSEFLFIYFRSF
jgi:hypothetical protein